MLIELVNKLQVEVVINGLFIVNAGEFNWDVFWSDKAWLGGHMESAGDDEEEDEEEFCCTKRKSDGKSVQSPNWAALKTKSSFHPSCKRST